MVDKKISELTSGGDPQAGDLFAVARAGATYKVLYEDLLETILTTIAPTTVTGPLSASTYSTIASVPTADYKSVLWHVTMTKGTTRWSAVLNAVQGGTDTGFTFSIVTILPENGGTFDFSFQVIISAPNLLLQVYPDSTGWSAEVTRLRTP